MAKQKSIYRRLTGRRRTLGGYSQLWIAADHLLLLKSSRFAEQYQRFAFADIQAIVVTELPGRLGLQIAMAAVALLWISVLLAVSSLFAKGFFAVTGGIALALVLIDIARGARCSCYLHTAVSRELLGPVSRMKSARGFVDQVRPAIESVQGTLATDRVVEVSANAEPASVPPEVRRPLGYLPEALFIVFLANAALILADQKFPTQNIGNLLVTTVFGEVVILIVALARRGERDTRRIVYGLIMAAIVGMGWDGYIVGRNFVSWISGVYEDTQHGRAAVAVWNLFTSKQAMLAAGWRIAAGAAGLTAAWFERREIDRKR